MSNEKRAELLRLYIEVSDELRLITQSEYSTSDADDRKYQK